MGEADKKEDGQCSTECKRDPQDGGRGTCREGDSREGHLHKTGQKGYRQLRKREERERESKVREAGRKAEKPRSESNQGSLEQDLNW